jgi:Holliday junction resolvase
VTDKKTKAALKKILEDKGFKVELIKETGEETPDLLASDSHTQLLIEIKERHSTDRSSMDGLDVRLDKVVRRNTLSGISKKARGQLLLRSTSLPDTF